MLLRGLLNFLNPDLIPLYSIQRLLGNQFLRIDGAESATNQGAVGGNLQPLERNILSLPTNKVDNCCTPPSSNETESI